MDRVPSWGICRDGKHFSAEAQPYLRAVKNRLSKGLGFKLLPLSKFEPQVGDSLQGFRKWT